MNDHEVYLEKMAAAADTAVPAPFDPAEAFPEYRLQGLSAANPVYAAIREMFRVARYDAANFGRPNWNPLGWLIAPGDRVLLKPNMVFHESHRAGEDYYSVVTHPAIIRCVVDYACIALQGRGEIVIGDAPLNNANFDKLRANLGLDGICERYKNSGVKVEVIDFRLYTMEKTATGVIHNQKTYLADGKYTTVKLDAHSRLCPVEQVFPRFRVTEYDGDSMQRAHHVGVHRYCFHSSILRANVVINLPKIKTHRKAGYTCALKNLVGLNGNKDWLPHHRKGSIAQGGDEYLNSSWRKRLISRSWDVRWRLDNEWAQRALLFFERNVHRTGHLVPFRDKYLEGSWWGNDTIARTIADLNRALLYCDTDGNLKPARQRKVFHLVDGIICGEGEGPMAAKPKKCGLLLMGSSALAVDWAVVTLMGFDLRKINTLLRCAEGAAMPIFDGTPEQVVVQTNLAPSPLPLAELRRVIGFEFEPSSGWKGHIELASSGKLGDEPEQGRVPDPKQCGLG